MFVVKFYYSVFLSCHFYFFNHEFKKHAVS